jgi:hypothetical protein
VEIQKALPPDFPLLSCCSSSDGYNMPAYGMSYQDFIRACNLVMLEMTGSTPSIKGTWDGRLPANYCIWDFARASRRVLRLGLRVLPDTAFFVWR